MTTTFQRWLVPVLVAVALIGLVNGASATSHEGTAGQYIQDSVVTAKVKAALFTDAALKTATIRVETSQGVVHLSGSVKSTEDLRRAEELAQGVEGVRGVRNDMRLK